MLRGGGTEFASSQVGGTVDNDSTQSQQESASPDSPDASTGTSTETPDSTSTAPAPTAPRRTPAAAKQLAEASAIILDDEGNEIGKAGEQLNLALGKSYKARLKAVFPAGTEKTLTVKLGYGIRYPDGYGFTSNAVTTAGWYQMLDSNKGVSNGITMPDKQSNVGDQPLKIHGYPTNNGTTTFHFQSGTQEVSFDIPFGVLAPEFTQQSIPKALTITTSYVDGQGDAQKVQTTSDVKVDPALSSVERSGIVSGYEPFLNADKQIEVGVGSPQGPGTVISWTGGLSQVAILDDYYMALEVPEGIQYDGAYQLGRSAIMNVIPAVLKTGEDFTLSTGEKYVVPAGRELYVWRVEKPDVMHTASKWRSISPHWVFPAEKFPIGSTPTVKLIDVGLKPYNHYGDATYLTYKPEKQPTITYKIVGQIEDVYVNTTLGKPKNAVDWPLWEGYIADNDVYLGAPGFEHTQERTLGYFTVGNRGTGDSKQKTIIIDYDIHNTEIAGVTSQAIPMVSKDADGLKKSVITDFKVTLKNFKTGEVFTRSVDPDKLKQRFRVETVLNEGESCEQIFIKKIEYKIDTIPAKKALTWYTNKNNGAWDAGYEGNGTSESFVYDGVVLKNTAIEKGGWSTTDPNLFFTRIRIENTDDPEPEFAHRNQDVWDWDGDGTAENNKYVGRSKDHVTIGDTFTAFKGKSFITGHGQLWSYQHGLIDPIIGQQVKNSEFSYHQPFWDGSSAGTERLKAIYVVSPYGSDMSIKVNSRHMGAKHHWLEPTHWNGGQYIGPQPPVYEVSASDALKAEYPNARVYKVDFESLPEKEKFELAQLGASVQWGEAAELIPNAINESYWAYDTETDLTINYTSDPKKDKAKEFSGVVWYDYYDEVEEGVELVRSSDGFATDKWDLNGNGSTEDIIGAPWGYVNPKAPTDVVVQSAAKKATQDDSQYITYDGYARTEIGANSDVDYRLVATNPTSMSVKGFSIYWPVPKKDQNWGKVMQPNGKFTYDMFLKGGIKSQLPEGYTVSYAKKVAPDAESLNWKDYEWTADKDTKNWTQADWDDVNFVRIQSPEEQEFAADAQMQFNFKLEIRGISDDELKMKLQNVMTPAYIRDLGSGKGVAYGQPVGMVVLAGLVGGTVWEDLDNDAVMDESEPRVPGVKLNLVDEVGTVVDFATSATDGTYSFKGLRADATVGAQKNYRVVVDKPEAKTDGNITRYARFAKVLPDGKGDNRFSSEDGTTGRTGLVMPAQLSADVTTETGLHNAIDEASREGTVPAFHQDLGLVPVTKVVVSKLWADKDPSKRQDVTAKLMVDDKAATDIDGKAASLTLTEAGKWAGEFTNLQVNDPQTNKPIAYSVKEDPVPAGYVDGVSGSIDKGFVITNTAKVTIPVTKVWVDNDNAKNYRPDSVTFTLLEDGKDTRTSLALEAKNEWKGAFTDLSPFGADGKTPAKYTIVEVQSDKLKENYTESHSGTAETGYTFTNTITGKRTVSVTKNWVGIDALEKLTATVQLKADGEAKGTPVVLNSQNEWQHSFADLPQYDAKGKEIVYTVEEVGVTNHKITIAGFNFTEITTNEGDTWTVINTFNNPKLTLTGQKVWDDADNQDGIRPDFITVRLIGDGEEVAKTDVATDSDGTFSFKDLPTYNMKGEKVVYELTEDEVEGYTSDIREGVEDEDFNFIVTNTHEPELVSVPVVKKWVDNNNEARKRPASVMIELKANGELVDNQVLTLDAAKNWMGSFADLPKFAEGKEIEYTVTEKAVKDYTTAITGSAADGFTVTNTIVPQGKSLARTGTDAVATITGATVLTLLGGAVVLAARRRRNG